MFRSKFSISEIVYIITQLKVLIKSGIVFSETFKTIAKSQKRKHKANLFNEMSQLLLKGYPLKQAINRADHFNLLPKTFKEMIIISYETGKYDETFDELIKYYNNYDTVLTEYRKVMFYPKFGLYFFLLSLIFVAPELLIFIIMTYLSMKFIYGEILSSKINKFIYFIPFIGSIKKEVLEYQFIMNFSILYDSGITLNRSLDSLKNLFSISKTDKVIEKIRFGINNNLSVYESFKGSNFFSDEFLSLLQVGEISGSISSSIIKAADSISNLTIMKLHNIAKVISPFFQLFGSFFIGGACMMLIFRFFG